MLQLPDDSRTFMLANDLFNSILRPAKYMLPLYGLAHALTIGGAWMQVGAP
jgi:hypothetical protein